MSRKQCYNLVALTPVTMFNIMSVYAMDTRISIPQCTLLSMNTKIICKYLSYIQQAWNIIDCINTMLVSIREFICFSCTIMGANSVFSNFYCNSYKSFNLLLSDEKNCEASANQTYEMSTHGSHVSLLNQVEIINLQSNTTGTTSGAGTVYPSHVFIPSA